MIVAVPTYGLYGEQVPERPDFWVHCETIAARSSAYQWEIGLHRHDSFFQILYIWDSAGTALIGEQTFPLSPPCVVLMPPGVSHGYRFEPDVQGIVLTFAADHLRVTAELQKRTGYWLGVPRVLTLQGNGCRDYIETTISRISEEFDAHRTGRNDLIEAYLTTVLTLLGRLSGLQDTDGSGGIHQLRVEALKAMIGRSFRAHLPAAEYARRLNMSSTHLNRIVRDVAGVTVHDMIMSRVIDEARRALVFTPATVQQVAHDLGFSDPGYFSRCFRRRTGQTPGAFRSSQRQKLSQVQSADQDGAKVVYVRAGGTSDEEVTDGSEARIAVMAAEKGPAIKA